MNNVAPFIDQIMTPLDPVAISDQPVSVSATFSDPAGTYDEPYTCSIDFGDGTGLIPAQSMALIVAKAIPMMSLAYTQ